MRHLCLALLALLACGAPMTAHAHGFGSMGDGIAILPGLTLGGALYHSELDSPGLFLGAEVSATAYDLDAGQPGGYTPTAIGGYVDAMWDFGADTYRMSFGPELAWFFMGVDGGYLMQLRGGEVGHGVSARLFATLLVPGVFLRVGKTWGGVEDTVVELGITLKIPVLLED